MSMIRLTRLTTSTAALVLTFSPAAAETVDVSRYPELSVEALLPPVIAELRRTLKDPSSVRDFTFCPARKVRLRDGKPVSWSVSFSFNARNSYGGYEGIRTYAAVFRDGRITGGVIATQMPGNDGFDGLINSSIARQMAACPMIPDAQLQPLLSGSVFKPG